jgi:hypothetical protein
VQLEHSSCWGHPLSCTPPLQFTSKLNLKQVSHLLSRLQDNDFPTDVDFKWAQDSYNVTQRNIDTWLFFGVFRARLWLLDQKWSYPGGFTGAFLCGGGGGGARLEGGAKGCGRIAALAEGRVTACSCGTGGSREKCGIAAAGGFTGASLCGGGGAKGCEGEGGREAAVAGRGNSWQQQGVVWGGGGQEAGAGQVVLQWQKR